MWVLCCALISMLWSREACSALVPWTGAPDRVLGLSRFLVSEPRLAFLGFPLPQKETAGFGEEGRSLFYLERLPLVVE